MRETQSSTVFLHLPRFGMIFHIRVLSWSEDQEKSKQT